jgi:hypothetical protein
MWGGRGIEAVFVHDCDFDVILSYKFNFVYDNINHMNCEVYYYQYTS